MAGVRGVTTGFPDAVNGLIDSNGQLGTISSSRRYKEAIEDMGSASERVWQLRPVTFCYREAFANGRKPRQFGLIAEEVAEQFSELAVFNQDGQPETVKYQDLAVLLLNEMIKERRQVQNLREKLARQEAVMSRQENEIAELRKGLAAMVGKTAALARQVEENAFRTVSLRAGE